MAASPRIAVVDYGAGNLRSVVKALARSGLDPIVTGEPEAVRGADAVVLPGVGFDPAFPGISQRCRSLGCGNLVACRINHHTLNGTGSKIQTHQE